MMEIGEAGYALAGVVFGSLATYLLGHRRIQAEHIVKERSAWREKIRTAMAMVAQKPSHENRRILWLTLSLNTNPFDQNDRRLVRLAKKISEQFEKSDFEELVLEVALLLKHDWERAKSEVRWFDFPPRRSSPERLKGFLLSREPR